MFSSNYFKQGHHFLRDTDCFCKGVAVSNAAIANAVVFAHGLWIDRIHGDSDESSHYHEYASPFLGMWVILLVSKSGLVRRVLLGLAISLFGVFLNLAVYRAKSLVAVMRENHSLDGVEEVRAALAPFGPMCIATSPISFASKLSVGMDDPQHYSFLNVLVCDRPSRRIPWPLFPAVYPYLDTRAEFLDEFDIDTIIVQRSDLHRLSEENATTQLTDWNRLTTPSYEIFIRNPVPNHLAGSHGRTYTEYPQKHPTI